MKGSRQLTLRISSSTLIGAIYLIAPACYAEEIDQGHSDLLVILVVALLILQSLLIAGLQHSRLRNKAIRNTLKNNQKELKEKILERTQNLHQKNIELETAIENQKAIAAQLMDTKRHLQTMINSVPDILVGISEDEKITYWNIAAYTKTGTSFDKALGAHILSVLPQLPITPEKLSQIIKSEQPFINQRIQHKENNELKFYDLRIYPLKSDKNSGAVVQLNNVTKQVHIESMMIQNEKMSSLGELAAGIAHEINNPLGIILHNVQNIIRRTSADLPSNITSAEKLGINFDNIHCYLQDRQVDQFLANIKEAGERAGSIVNNMLDFSRTNYNEKTWVDIQKLITQAIELNINASFSETTSVNNIQVNTIAHNDIPLIYASAPELQQVLLNLLRNAYQALMSSSANLQEDPLVTISITHNIRPHEIVIEVSDNGPGIKDNIKEHIFEPFFTTKEVGKGTGLGLSVSYFIITEHHQGSISVSSPNGKGATFKINLPILAAQHSFDI